MKLNEKCVALIEYKNKNILKPILNVENNLLAPIVFNQHILNEIEFLLFILSRFSYSNIVKLWLLSKLEQDKIIINAKINEGTNELLNKIIRIENETIHREYVRGINGYYGPIIIYRQYNKIVEDNLYSKFIFKFNENETSLDKTLFKDNLDQSNCGCYIITFNNKFYYYIGSSTNLKYRIKTHTLNIKKYINAIQAKDAEAKKSNTLNDMFKFYLDSSILYHASTESEMNDLFEEQELNKLGFNIKILYLNTNYLNLFKSIYPDYKLSKGEWILLNKITDLITKLLEESLIIKFYPKLNISNKVVFKHFEWSDEFLDIYSRNNKAGEYLKNTKYGIYILLENRFSNKVLGIFGKDTPLIYKNKLEKLIYVSNLQDICYRYCLKPYEVLINLNEYHNYSTTNLKNPLKIIEVDR